jgi:hypothetical protein
MSNIVISVDTEASGPVPGLFDMISVGLVVIEPGLSRTFYAEFAPLHDRYIQGAYDSIGVTREQHLAMPDPEIGARAMVDWAESLGSGRQPTTSDNPAFDFPFLSWYAWKYTGRNPFGHSSRRIGDFAAGLNRSWSGRQDWKKLRQTKHTHNALDDSKGNAEALMTLFQQNDLKAPWDVK